MTGDRLTLSAAGLAALAARMHPAEQVEVRIPVTLAARIEDREVMPTPRLAIVK